MIDTSTIQLLLIPSITGLVQAFKNAGMPSKYAPFVAVILGVGSALLIEYSWLNVFVGVLTGLSSVGLYEFPKALAEPKPVPIPEKVVIR